MFYELFLIAILQSGQVQMNHVGTYDDMTQCFTERDVVVEELGRPIINYQAVCVLTENKVEKN